MQWAAESTVLPLTIAAEALRLAKSRTESLVILKPQEALVMLVPLQKTAKNIVALHLDTTAQAFHPFTARTKNASVSPSTPQRAKWHWATNTVISSDLRP